MIFGLRGVKSNLGEPHRNLVDFAHVPVVKSLTRMPVCIDPSHAVGSRRRGPEGILDVMHATAQGVIAGANMILVDFHPAPRLALVDGPQALLLEELPQFLEDVQIAHEAYHKRLTVAERYRETAVPAAGLMKTASEPGAVATGSTAILIALQTDLVQRTLRSGGSRSDLPTILSSPRCLTHRSHGFSPRSGRQARSVSPRIKDHRRISPRSGSLCLIDQNLDCRAPDACVLTRSWG